MDDLKVWYNGEMLEHSKALVPISTHSLQYGSGIFEGIRGYRNEKGPAIFRLEDHMNRFFDSAKIYRMKLPYGRKELEKAIVDVVRANSLDDCYIRPFAFISNHSGLLRPKDLTVGVYIWAFPFGAYFGSSISTGVRCKVSSWQRISSRSLPIQAKASGNYLNSMVAIHDAKESGYDEAILTSLNGYVAEGPGENIFLVKNNEIITPGKDSDILLGITRDTIIRIARDEGYSVRERFVHREELYTADEVFFTGTAAEVTPVVEIDNVMVGDGKVGEITRNLSLELESIIRNDPGKYSSWLTYVE